MKKPGNLARVVALLVGFVLIFLGGISFTLTTVPGVALVVWSLAGKGLVKNG